MGDLTKNISRHEVACHCGCGDDSMDIETIRVVQEVCDHFARFMARPKVTLIVTSGYRCLKHNNSKAVGSNSASQHPRGRAMDINIVDVHPHNVYDYLDKKYPGKYGIGKYDDFTHIDTRTNGPARW